MPEKSCTQPWGIPWECSPENAVSCQNGWEALPGTACWALTAFCCGLATSPNLSRLSNRPLSWHMVLDVLGSQLQDLSFWYELGVSERTVRTRLESQQGPMLNWECKRAPFWPRKWAPVIFHNPSEHRHSDVGKHLFATEGSNRYTWGNRNFLCEEKYLKQCTAASFGEELEKDTWQFKWNWSYICTSHQMHFYHCFL